MKKLLVAALAAITALTGVMSASVVSAQPYDHQDWNRDHDRGNHNGWDRGDHDRGNWDHGDHDRGDHDRRDWGRRDHQWRYYGGHYGYSGYRGPWREGQRYPHWHDRRYVVSDWQAYRLPPPRPGYRYCRDDNGDIVMVAVASGVIGLIVGSALAN